MEIATMPFVAEAAPPAVTRTQGRDSGGGQGKSADSFADLMKGAIGEGTGEAAQATEPAAKTAAKTAEQADGTADTSGTPVFAVQIPASLLTLLTQQTPPTDGTVTAIEGEQTAAVTGIQAVATGAGTQSTQSTQPAFATLMATAGQTQTETQTGQPGVSGAKQQANLPQMTAQTPAQAMPTATDSLADVAKAATTPADFMAAGSQQGLQVQPQPTTTAGTEVNQTAQSSQPQFTVAVQPQIPTQVVQVQQQVQAGKEPLLQVTAAQAEQPQPTESQTASATTVNTAVPAPAPTQTAPATGGQNQGDQAATGDSSKGDQAAAATTDQPTPVTTFPLTLDRQPAISQAAAPTDTTQTQAPNDPYNVAGQIVDQAKLITKQDSSEMIIRLKPEHLGEVTMKISVAESGAVSASFHAANPEVRGAIEATLTQLRQDLSNQGLKVDNVGIYASLDQFFRGDQQQAPQQQQQIKLTARRKDEEDFTESVAAVSSQYQPSGSGGIDYRI